MFSSPLGGINTIEFTQTLSEMVNINEEKNGICKLT